MKFNKKQTTIFALYFICLLLTACAIQRELEEDATTIVTRTRLSFPTPTQTSKPTKTSLVDSVDMITSVPLPNYLYGVFPESATVYNIASDEYLSRLSRKDPYLSEPSVCASVSSYHLLEKGDAPSEREFLRQMRLIVNEETHSIPNVTISPDILGYDVMDPETGEVLFRTPDGEDFNVCWPVDLSEPGLYMATFIFTKTSGKEESYTWSFIIEE